MKTLLKIENLKEGVCQTELQCETRHEYEMTAASILSLMDKNDLFAITMMNVCALYALKRKEVSAINDLSIKMGKAKTQN